MTAVEWFYDKIKSHFEHDGDLLESLTFTMSIAKQMEKEQIKNAYEHGMDLSNYEEEWGEEYYNETYNNAARSTSE